MTRRKKPPQQRKVHQITDPSGWTHVTKGPPGIIDPSTIGIHLENGKYTQTKYTQETYRDRLRTHYAPTWRASTCFGALSLILERDILPAGNLVITQCVCLGLGSLTAGSESSSYELAALVSILEILGKKHHIRDIIFQDPVFNALDRSVLQGLGYTVVETPDALAKFNGTTFLFAPHLECGHYATALGTATPVLSVGSDLHVYVDGLLSSLAESTKKGSGQIFRDFLGKTDSKPMPDFDRTSWCESTRIHWLKSQEDHSEKCKIEQAVRSMKIVQC